jgi:hypothetical protein
MYLFHKVFYFTQFYWNAVNLSKFQLYCANLKKKKQKKLMTDDDNTVLCRFSSVSSPLLELQKSVSSTVYPYKTRSTQICGSQQIAVIILLKSLSNSDHSLHDTHHWIQPYKSSFIHFKNLSKTLYTLPETPPTQKLWYLIFTVHIEWAIFI